MYSFEGDFRRKPVQALGGASKKEPKEVLLQRTQEERRRREEQKRRLDSAIRIQSCYRSSVVRKEAKQQLRLEYDTCVEKKQAHYTASENRLSHGSSKEIVQDLMKLTQLLLFFYNPAKDSSRLSWLCQQMVIYRNDVSKLVSAPASAEFHRLKRLLTVCCQHIEGNADNISMSLRMLEIYTDPETFSWVIGAASNWIESMVTDLLFNLVCKGYYQCIKSLIENRLPPSIHYVSSQGSGSQHAMAETVLMLVKRPLLLITSCADQTSFGNEVLKQLCKSMFSSRYTEPVRNFLLPMLASDHQFPFATMFHSMLPITLSQSQVNADNNWALTVQPSLWLLHSTLHMSELHLEMLSDTDTYKYLLVLYKLVPQLNFDAIPSCSQDDSDDEQMNVEPESDIVEIVQECVEKLNQPTLVQRLVALASVRRDQSTMTAIASICHALLYYRKCAIHRTRLLYNLAFNRNFLRNLWIACEATSSVHVTGCTFLLSMLSRGLTVQEHEFERIVPVICTFSCLFTHVLTLMYDTEFYGTSISSDQSSMPFSLDELQHMALTLRDLCRGIIELTHPDTKPFYGSFHQVDPSSIKRQQSMLSYAFKVAVGLVKQLHQRDCRRSFCSEGHWLLQQPLFHLDKPSNLFTPKALNLVHQPFGSLSILNPNRSTEEDVPRLSSTEMRKLIVLTEMPFVVSFEDRVKIFHQLIHQDKSEHQGHSAHFGMGPSINISVRRNYLYEDAYEKLSFENEPNLKLRMRVRLQNFAGLDEAGIDGGGLFREFVSELIKTAFDPNRGFFLSTADKLLYPNPQARLLVDNFTSHYFFLGRILGKALYENMLLELPFASFFLSKLLSHAKGDVDINHLASLDPEMYRNLLYLKDYDADVSELNLDFTVVNNELGEAQVEELKRDGRNIIVNNSNRIEYIHLMADYRLNRQIRAHCHAFRSGLNDVVNNDWLRLFDHNELQVLISGAQVPIDFDDLRQHTNYSGGYTAEHPVIVMFWRVVTAFDDKQRRQLLKFVTSCSRPPLLGFKNLHPSFCIHHAGNEADRLPTASTCMNLLKLPEFKDEEMLRLKLLYAIESGAGFELS